MAGLVRNPFLRSSLVWELLLASLYSGAVVLLELPLWTLALSLLSILARTATEYLTGRPSLRTLGIFSSLAAALFTADALLIISA